jgi:hypothetical protein
VAKRGTRVLDRVKDDNLELEDSQMPRKMDEKCRRIQGPPRGVELFIIMIMAGRLPFSVAG